MPSARVSASGPMRSKMKITQTGGSHGLRWVAPGLHPDGASGLQRQN